ncbi:hypothetical protein RI820_001541 [Pluralibacter gergoviae]|nr:hypothetical protein [Pluralibacter gergoviae]ELC3019160.1 hypothetical protein [Pluralibacter gergoviae]ELC3021644.1 hypothetical protein [Pluralibacter gergoviae]
MSKLILGLTIFIVSFSVNAAVDPVAFVKKMPYRQVVKDAVLARCIAKVSDDNTLFSSDAAQIGVALLEWIPFNLDNCNEKINAIINKYKDTVNASHSERKPITQGVTLNCLRLYHGDELDRLVPQLIDGNPERTWYQDNPQ